MTKSQFEKEVKNKIELLIKYIGEVQNIPNYRDDIECQDYFTMVNNTIRKMRKTISNCTSLPDADFKNLDFNKIFADIEYGMEAPKSCLDHIKSKGCLEKRPQSYFSN